MLRFTLCVVLNYRTLNVIIISIRTRGAIIKFKICSYKSHESGNLRMSNFILQNVFLLHILASQITSWTTVNTAHMINDGNIEFSDKTVRQNIVVNEKRVL